MTEPQAPLPSSPTSSQDVIVPKPPPTQIYSAPIPEQPAPSVYKRRFLFWGIGIIVLAFIFIASGVFVYAGYNDVRLPLLSESQQIEFQKTYARLPIVPKSAKQILLLASDKSTEMKSYEFKFSAGLDISQKQSVGGLSAVSFDISANGAADLTDKKKPVIDLNTKIKSTTPLVPLTFEMLFLAKDSKLYLNIKEFSGVLASYANFTPVLNKWFVQDMSALDTDARSLLDQEKTDDKTVTQHTQQWFLKVFSDREISSRIKKVNEEKIGDEVSYHLTFSPTTKDIVRLVEYVGEEQNRKLTDSERAELEKGLVYFKDVKFDLWIGQQSYLPRKTTLTFEYAPETPNQSGYDAETAITPFSSLSGVTFKAAFSMEIPSVNKPVNVEVPQNATDFQEFYSALNGGSSTNTSSQAGQVRDSGIKSDLGQIATGLEVYATTDKGLYPAKLEDLLIAYLKKIPTHPDSGEQYVYASSKSRSTALVYAKLSSPQDPQKPYYFWESQNGVFGMTNKASLDQAIASDLSPQSLKALISSN